MGLHFYEKCAKVHSWQFIGNCFNYYKIGHSEPTQKEDKNVKKTENCLLCKWPDGTHDPVCPNGADGEEKGRRMLLYEQGLREGRDDQPHFHERVNAHVSPPTTAFHLGHENGIFGE